MTTDYRTNNKVCRGMALGHDDKGQEEHIGGFSNLFFPFRHYPSEIF